MGSKYHILAFDYPFKGCWDYSRQTQWLIVALFWVVYYCMKHFGVHFEKRG